MLAPISVILGVLAPWRPGGIYPGAPGCPGFCQKMKKSTSGLPGTRARTPDSPGWFLVAHDALTVECFQCHGERNDDACRQDADDDRVDQHHVDPQAVLRKGQPDDAARY